MLDRGEVRGQVSIGTLVIFVAMVVLSAVAAGVLINTAGVFQPAPSGSSGQALPDSTDAPAPTERPVGLEVVVAVGHVEDGRIDRVTVTVGLATGSAPLDLRDVRVHLTHPDGSATLVHERTADAAPNRRFATVAVADADDSEPLLDDPGDRVQVVVDLAAVGGGAALGPGESATLELETPAGDTWTVPLEVPASLDGRHAVEL